MALSLQGWMIGLSASGVVIFGFVLGLFCIYQAKKTNAKLLFYLGLLIIILGLTYLGVFLDFLTVLLTRKNIDNTYGIVGILSFVFVAPLALISMYVGAELLMPEKKWYILSVTLVLSIIFELFIFIDTMNSFNFIYPENPGDDIIDYNLDITSPAGILFLILALLLLTFLVFGFLYKSIQSEGVIRKKFLLLSIGFFFVFLFGGVFEALTETVIALIFFRIGYMSSFGFFYFGLREEPEKKEKIKPIKEVKVKGDLFRISQYRREDITEEEVSISKEKKICLVCKNKISRLNYICPECNAFYCFKCSDVLVNLENACWVCETPFDESKPVKPFKKEREIDVEISEKPQKKLQTPKY